MHWLKLLKNNLNQQQFKSKHLQASYLEGFKMMIGRPSFSFKRKL